MPDTKIRHLAYPKPIAISKPMKIVPVKNVIVKKKRIVSDLDKLERELQLIENKLTKI